MNFYYCISDGIMYRADGTVLFDGCYSGGNKGRNPEAINNPNYCNVKDTGPIPVGNYSIGQPYDDQLTGSHTMSLTPDNLNVMFGRSEFKIHGDNPKGDRSASEGCIIKSPAQVRCQVKGGNLTVVAFNDDVPFRAVRQDVAKASDNPTGTA